MWAIDSNSPSSKCFWIIVLWHCLSALSHILQVVVQVAQAFSKLLHEARIIADRPRPARPARRAPIVRRSWPSQRAPVRTAPPIPTAPPRSGRQWTFSNENMRPLGRATIFRTVTQRVPQTAGQNQDTPPPYVRTPATNRQSNNNR